MHDPTTATAAAAGVLRHPQHLAQLRGAAITLVALTDDAPDVRLTDCQIDPATGRITLQVTTVEHAQALADRLGLPTVPRITEVDDGWLCRRWVGQWADWPIVVVHTWHETTPGGPR